MSVVLGVLLVTHASGAAATGVLHVSARGCEWSEVLSVPGGFFTGVVATTDGTVWAVGYQTPRRSNKTYPLITIWDGRKWSTTVGKGIGKHEDVLASSSGDVWLTGVRNGQPVLLRFDGRKWTTSFREVYFGGSQRADSMWMREGRQLIRIDQLGRETRLGIPQSIDEAGLFTVDSRGRVWVDDSSSEKFHLWDGRRWSVYPYPGDVYLLYAMDTGSPDNVWQLATRSPTGTVGDGVSFLSEAIPRCSTTLTSWPARRLLVDRTGVVGTCTASSPRATDRGSRGPTSGIDPRAIRQIAPPATSPRLRHFRELRFHRDARPGPSGSAMRATI